ncbi:hypothetical protein MTO96_004823 [Rhipicephalus appendiculatus]
MEHSMVPAFPFFDARVTDANNVGTEWLKWVKRFENFIVACGITDDARKTALLLPYDEITYSLEDTANRLDPRVAYPDLFNGVGCLRDFQVHLHVDPSVQPVAQPHRRIPFSMRKPLEEELKRLQSLDITERAEGPTPWVSPIVAVLKPHDPEHIRVCADMRCANEAIQRERDVTPTVDDVLVALNGSVIFSKLDLKDRYHQLELGASSRVITTFSTHAGLFRYKRLNFRINSAAEVFQDTIQQVLANIPNVLNVSDDILVHGKTEREHDEALRGHTRMPTRKWSHAE